MDYGTDINPDGQNVISRRIVEVTDHDETIFAEFIEIDAFVVRLSRVKMNAAIRRRP